MQKREEGKLHGSSCYRPFLLSGYFPSWRYGFGTRPWGISHTQDRAGRFQDRHLQGCPLLVPDCGEGVLSRGGEKLAAYGILGCGEMTFALLPVYSL